MMFGDAISPAVEALEMMFRHDGEAGGWCQYHADVYNMYVKWPCSEYRFAADTYDAVKREHAIQRASKVAGAGVEPANAGV